MMPTTYNEQAPVPPPSYSRTQVQAQAQRARALHINALSLIETLHLLALCQLAVQLAHRRCLPPLAKGPGGAPRAHRPDLIRSPKRVLAHLWEDSDEELHQYRSENLWRNLVCLTFQGAALCMRHDLRDRSRRVAHPRRTRPTVDHECRDRDRSQPFDRQRAVVPHDRCVVDERVRHGLHRRPEWLVAHLGYEFGRNLRRLRHEVFSRVASAPRRNQSAEMLCEILRQRS